MADQNATPIEVTPDEAAYLAKYEAVGHLMEGLNPMSVYVALVLAESNPDLAREVRELLGDSWDGYHDSISEDETSRITGHLDHFIEKRAQYMADPMVGAQRRAREFGQANRIAQFVKAARNATSLDEVKRLAEEAGIEVDVTNRGGPQPPQSDFLN